MIRPLLLVFSLFSVCTFLMCSAGNPGSSLDNENVSTLNKVLEEKWWKQLVAQAKFRELKSISGVGIDVSDLLNAGADGNIVTPTNYIDKLVKSSTVLTCFYGETQKYITDMFVKIIAGRCESIGSEESKLDCIGGFWETMDISESKTKNMLVLLNYFYKYTKDKCTETLIDALESLSPFYDRQKYNKSKYFDADGAFKKVDFVSDYNKFFSHMDCVSKLLRNFLIDRCWPPLNDEYAKYDNMKDIAAMAETSQNQSIDALLKTYVKNLQNM